MANPIAIVADGDHHSLPLAIDNGCHCQHFKCDNGDFQFSMVTSFCISPFKPNGAIFAFVVISVVVANNSQKAFTNDDNDDCYWRKWRSSMATMAMAIGDDHWSPMATRDNGDDPVAKMAIGFAIVDIFDRPIVDNDDLLDMYWTNTCVGSLTAVCWWDMMLRATSRDTWFVLLRAVYMNSNKERAVIIYHICTSTVGNEILSPNSIFSHYLVTPHYLAKFTKLGAHQIVRCHQMVRSRAFLNHERIFRNQDSRGGVNVLFFVFFFVIFCFFLQKILDQNKNNKKKKKGWPPKSIIM